jgi:nucleoid-associated protein YgaU
MIAGNGFFKPNISSMVGQLYKKGDSRIDAAYTIFYMGINTGGALGPIVCGFFGDTGMKGDFKWAFLAGGIAMLLSVITQMLFQKKYLVDTDGAPVGEAPVDAPEADDTTFGEVAEPSVDAEAALSQDAVNTEDTASYKLEEAQPVTDVETPASEPSPALELESAPAPIAEEQPVVEDVAAPQAAEVANNDIGSELIYVVHRGESLSSVATQFLGKAKLWRKLAKLNKISNPNRIEVGMMLKIPVSDENRSKVEEFVAANEKKTKVKRGDTLAKIAKRVLGTKNAWRYLWKANESLIPNPNRIEVGQELGYLSKSSRRGTRKSAPNSH